MKMEMKDGTETVVINNGNFVEETEGEGEVELSSCKFSHLLASKDRDFLLSSTGAQVFSPLFLSIAATC